MRKFAAWKTVISVAVLAAACSGSATAVSTTAGDGASPATTAQVREPVTTTGPSSSTSPPPAAVPTTVPPAEPDPELVAATCEALETQRLSGRRAALETWDEANRSIPFTERTDALDAACGEVLANHRAAESLIRRTDDLFSIGYRGERECTETRGAGTISNRNDVAMDVLAIVESDGDGYADGWGYEVATRVVADELRPVTIEWIVPKSSPACGVWTREWLSDGSPATATVHDAGDPPGAELPDGAPPLNTTGDDWFEIVRSLIEFQYWVEANPDPDLLEEYEDVRSGNRAEVLDRLSDWVAFDRYQVRTGFELRDVELLETIDEHTVVLLIEVGPGTITRYTEGETVDTIDSDAYREIGVFRRSAYDERWRWLILSFIVQIDD